MKKGSLTPSAATFFRSVRPRTLWSAMSSDRGRAALSVRPTLLTYTGYGEQARADAAQRDQKSERAECDRSEGRFRASESTLPEARSLSGAITDR
jgi:hypothetical protein